MGENVVVGSKYSIIYSGQLNSPELEVCKVHPHDCHIKWIKYNTLLQEIEECVANSNNYRDEADNINEQSRQPGYWKERPLKFEDNLASVLEKQ